MIDRVKQTINMKLGGKLSRLGPNHQKILLLISSGVALSLSKSSRTHFRIIKETSKEWQKISDRALNMAITSLYKSKLISEQAHPDGSTTMLLTQKGKERTLRYNIETIELLKPQKWDMKWRLVTFDVPEKKRKARDALRGVLKNLGFYEYQKSVFIYPYHCQNELDYVIEFYKLRPYVRTVVATSIDNDLHIRQIFNLQ